ncbi:V-type ATP synthase subunit I [Erysipelatoclostridium sp. AM42-17]|mgnify:CR=1 FL=1|uniref:V-type ATP synthase subunit I n=1 Tax=Erysipelatoclostridium sp. AM42-17 TaxID=2293102 RepID=UPI000E554FB6|nr:V-type ATPase 116kDa subunit family protein [Erysipelatoclostridium sp. AM42-17]RHS92645.1 V-type ATP synthase subunit I [Erysipelatoclostridium sp. AM42-17]
MAITKLNLVNVDFNKDCYNSVLLKLYNHDDFHPELASKFTDSVAGLTVYNKDNLYEELLVRIQEMTEKYHFQAQTVKTESNQLNVVKVKEFLDDLFLDIDRIDAVKEQLLAMIKENDDAIVQLRHVAGLDVNFDDLFSCQYLQVRFGKIPNSNVGKLEFYESLPFVYKSFEMDERYTWCMYITTPGDAPEVDNVFTSLYFERIHIPEFIHGEADLAIAEIQDETNSAKEHSVQLQKRIDKIISDNIDEVNRIYTIASELNSVYIMQKYIVVMGDKLTVTGFVPAKKVDAFKNDFESIGNVHVEVLPATSDVRLEPPTLLKNSWFARPFRMFVEMYGVPKYNDVDPTLLVALSYTLLFGIMFGDLGQGILLSIVGFVAYKKFNLELGAVGMRLGISSAFFGIIFGSVFGSEEILIPMFNAMSPENTMTLLMAAIGLGVVLILISMIFNVVLNFKKKNIGEALLSQNGICGVTFYVAVIVAVVGMFTGLNIVNALYVIVFIVIPIFLIFLKEPLIRKFEEHQPMFPNGFGAFFVEGFFELFEVVLSFITNTMSFLRVGGFVLSHAGMMLVVYTLAGMFGSIGELVVIILGNIFVMCLEGMIVGIQVLRLEFYEMFSRYYEGNGIPFKTIKE